MSGHIDFEPRTFAEAVAGPTCRCDACEEFDGAPLTREEVTAGWTPRYPMDQAHQQKMEARG